jgi:hypothetical protein
MDSLCVALMILIFLKLKNKRNALHADKCKRCLQLKFETKQKKEQGKGRQNKANNESKNHEMNELNCNKLNSRNSSKKQNNEK